MSSEMSKPGGICYRIYGYRPHYGMFWWSYMSFEIQRGWCICLGYTDLISAVTYRQGCAKWSTSNSLVVCCCFFGWTIHLLTLDKLSISNWETWCKTLLYVIVKAIRCQCQETYDIGYADRMHTRAKKYIAWIRNKHGGMFLWSDMIVLSVIMTSSDSNTCLSRTD